MTVDSTSFFSRFSRLMHRYLYTKSSFIAMTYEIRRIWQQVGRKKRSIFLPPCRIIPRIPFHEKASSFQNSKGFKNLKWIALVEQVCQQKSCWCRTAWRPRKKKNYSRFQRAVIPLFKNEIKSIFNRKWPHIHTWPNTLECRSIVFIIIAITTAAAFSLLYCLSSTW